MPAPTPDQLPPPGPSNRVYREPCPLPIRSHPEWVTVRCPECGKTLCEATPGSTIKKLCNRCKEERVVMVAA